MFRVDNYSRDLEILHFESFFGMYSTYDTENAEENKERSCVSVYEIMRYIVTPSCFLYEG